MTSRPLSLGALAAAALLFLAPASSSAPSLEGELVYHRSRVPALAPRAEMLFAGDMMFDRSVRAVAEKEGGDFLFSCIEAVLREADMVVANLEGPVTPYPSVSVGSVIGTPENFTFTFPPETAALLARHNIRLVNIGNNHIMNFGRDGLSHTKRYLEEADVDYFGDPDASEAERVARISARGIPVSFVNWSDWTSDKTDHTIAQVRKEAEEGNIVFVYTHWGDEYAPPPPRVVALARQFAEAGADIVVGSHPHVVLESEVHAGTPIYYSLGNFIFDQYWDESVKTGLMLRVIFSREGVEAVEEISVSLEEDRRTCLTQVE